MRRAVSCVLFVTACGGSGSSTSGALVVSGSGTISTSSSTTNATTMESVALHDDAAPSALSYTLSGDGRSIAADANALIAALGGSRLDSLTGSELHVNEVFSGDGMLSGSASPQNLSFAYAVQAYSPGADPFLEVSASASSSGTSVFAMLTFSAP